MSHPAHPDASSEKAATVAAAKAGSAAAMTHAVVAAVTPEMHGTQGRNAVTRNSRQRTVNQPTRPPEERLPAAMAAPLGGTAAASAPRAAHIGVLAQVSSEAPATEVTRSPRPTKLLDARVRPAQRFRPSRGAATPSQAGRRRVFRRAGAPFPARLLCVRGHPAQRGFPQREGTPQSHDGSCARAPRPERLTAVWQRLDQRGCPPRRGAPKRQDGGRARAPRPSRLPGV